MTLAVERDVKQQINLNVKKAPFLFCSVVLVATAARFYTLNIFINDNHSECILQTTDLHILFLPTTPIPSDIVFPFSSKL